MGIPHPATRGGPPTHLPLLVNFIRHHPDFLIRTFYYGSRRSGVVDHECIVKKIFVTVYTYIEFLWHVLMFRPHVIHLNTAFGCYALLRDAPIALTAWLFRLNLLSKLHGSLDEIIHSRNPAICALSWILFKGSRIIGVLTETERREFESQYRLGNKLRLVKNMVPPLATTTECTQYTFPKNDTHALFVSRIDPRKGLVDLIDALPLIVEDLPSFRVIVAGDGPSLEECKQAAENNGSSRYIYWLGWVDPSLFGELYSVAQLFIFPTNYSEGMPMALISAMQAGLPIITTRCKFANDFLIEDKHYLAINRRDPVDIQKQVIRLLNNKELQRHMKAENLKFVSAYSTESVGYEYVRLYNELSGTYRNDR